MEDRKEVSVFKSICWCILLLVISLIVAILIAVVWGFIIGWLSGHIGIVNRLLSNKIVLFLFMTATTADIGRRTSRLMMALFQKPMLKSKSVGKGFLGAGILLMVYCIVSIIAVVLRGNITYFDLTAGTLGLWYILYGAISEDK